MGRPWGALRQIAGHIKSADLRAMDDLATDTNASPDATARRKACQQQVRSLVRRLLQKNVPAEEILQDLEP